MSLACSCSFFATAASRSALSCTFSSRRALNDDKSTVPDDEESTSDPLDEGSAPDVVMTGSNDFPSSLAD